MCNINYNQFPRDQFISDAEYEEYLEGCDQHGLAWHLRYSDFLGYTLDSFEEEFEGEWDSFEEYAEYFFDEVMECPDSVRYYVDIEKFARDLSHDFSTYDSPRGVYVFRDI